MVVNEGRGKGVSLIVLDQQLGKLRIERGHQRRPPPRRAAIGTRAEEGTMAATARPTFFLAQYNCSPKLISTDCFIQRLASET